MSDSGQIRESGRSPQVEAGEWVGEVDPVRDSAVPVHIMHLVGDDDTAPGRQKGERAAAGASDEWASQPERRLC